MALILCNHPAESYCKANKLPHNILLSSKNDFLIHKTQVQQNNFLAKLIIYDENKKSPNYHILNQDKVLKRICLFSFKNIFGISTNRIERIKFKIQNNISILEHKRKGKVKIENDEIRNLIKNHINSFPAEESHYERNKTKKNYKYLDPDLNCSEMHRLFKEKYTNTEVTYSVYKKIFDSEFDLKFKVPSSDKCKSCEKLKGLISNTKTIIEKKV